MVSLLAQIAPQRSTQYAALADALAPYELELSPLRCRVSGICPLRLGGQNYLKFDLPEAPDEHDLRELGTLAMTSAYFLYYERLGDCEGPFLRPLEQEFESAFPGDLVATRRYKGKTNELFTHFLCNLARASSEFSNRPWAELRVFDPLAGGGTTLFTALTLGGEAAGVERDAQDVQSTVTFLEQYLKNHGIASKVKQERLRKLGGRRWSFAIDGEIPRRLVLAQGETARSDALIEGFRPHLIVTDLPYGLQHSGPLASLLSEALPVWASLLPAGGTLVFAWDSTRFHRGDMISLVESACTLSVLDEPPYNQLAHRVDRAIKQRDVLVARRPG